MRTTIHNPPLKSSRIRVLLVDDSILALTVLKGILSLSPDIEVVGTARHGKEALELIPRLNPQVICTDLHMPTMDGLGLTKVVMAEFPRPILVISVSVDEDSAHVFELLQAGAVDVFPKPRGGLDVLSSQLREELVKKIRVLAGVQVVGRRHATKFEPSSVSRSAALPFASDAVPVRLVVVGASTGGPQALATILPKPAAGFSVPVVCVQHIAEGFLQGLVEWLSPQCGMTISIARAGTRPIPGNIYFAPEGRHLLFHKSGGFVVSSDAPHHGHRPSITVTMRSSAEAYGNAVAGILLTGMGADGAEGMRAISEAGGITIAQDEASSVVFGMPKQAIAMGAAKYVMSPEEIGNALMNGIGRRPQESI